MSLKPKTYTMFNQVKEKEKEGIIKDIDEIRQGPYSLNQMIDAMSACEAQLKRFQVAIIRECNPALFKKTKENQYVYMFEKITNILVTVPPVIVFGHIVNYIDDLKPILLEFYDNLEPVNRRTRERIEAYRVLFKKNPACLVDYNVPCVIYLKREYVLSDNEAISPIRLPPSALAPLALNPPSGVQRIVAMFERRFAPYLRASSLCRFPHICAEDLRSQLAARSHQIGQGNVETIILRILAINDFLFKSMRVLMENEKENKKVNKKEKANYERQIAEATKKQPEDPLMLGIWRRFEWLDIAMMNNYGSRADVAEIIRTSLSLSPGERESGPKTRLRIPACVRLHVWRKTNNDQMTGECYVCSNQMSFHEMECGHILAHIMGGAATVENLMPVCRTCNRDMGIMNLEIYKDLVMTAMGTNNKMEE